MLNVSFEAQQLVDGCFRGRGRTSQETVKLHEEFEVNIITLRSFAMAAPHVVRVQVDTCWGLPNVSQSVVFHRRLSIAFVRSASTLVASDRCNSLKGRLTHSYGWYRVWVLSVGVVVVFDRGLRFNFLAYFAGVRSLRLPRAARSKYACYQYLYSDITVSMTDCVH